MKKITIVALHLGYGGIEKAIASLANMLCDEYQINIVSTYKLYDKTSFFIDDRVKITYLMDDRPNKAKFLASLKRVSIPNLFKEGLKSLKILYLRKKSMIKAIKENDSDIIISTRPFHNRLVGKYAKEGITKIAWEHAHHNNNKGYVNKLIKSCEKIDYLVSVSKSLNDFYTEKTTNKQIVCKYISLALDSLPNCTSKLDNKEMIAVGRLSKEKGFISLVDVFKIVNKTHPDWHLNIVGDGMEKDNILKAINTHQLENNITMHGFKRKEELETLMCNSSIYIMTSFTESFGLVLIEAMSYGIPCISFSSAQGSLEIIDDGINGYLIANRDKQDMVDRIKLLIKDNDLRKKMGKKARAKALQYSPDKVKKEWLRLLKSGSKK